MTAPGSPSRDDVLAPVDFVAVEFPDGAPTAEGFEELLDLEVRLASNPGDLPGH